MTAKHTPAPWHWGEAAETIHGFDEHGEARVVVHELGTNEHDARLIAAAPDMLTAMLHVADYLPFDWAFDSDPRYMGQDDLRAAVAKVRAAIALATGKQK